MELHGVALVLVGHARRVPPGLSGLSGPGGGMSCACAMSIEVTLESAVSGAQMLAAWARSAEAWTSPSAVTTRAGRSASREHEATATGMAGEEGGVCSDHLVLSTAAFACGDGLTAPSRECGRRRSGRTSRKRPPTLHRDSTAGRVRRPRPLPAARSQWRYVPPWRGPLSSSVSPTGPGAPRPDPIVEPRTLSG